MNFSFLDISIKSPHDLFSWNRIKSTLLLGLYIFSRSILIFLGSIFLIFFIWVILQVFPNIQSQLWSMWTYKEVEILISYLLSSILYYRFLYIKRYKSFEPFLYKNQKPQFWSWFFWKRNLIFTSISNIIHYVIATPTQLTSVEDHMHLFHEILLHEIIFYGIVFYGIVFFISHLCLHCGFWGVSYEAK